MIIGAGIVNQIIIGLFWADEGLKLNSANFCDFIDKIFFAYVGVTVYFYGIYLWYLTILRWVLCYRFSLKVVYSFDI